MAEDKRVDMALDGYTVKADAQGRGPRQIKERPTPPAPIASKAATTSVGPSEKKSTEK
jgi:hypothetical protein